MEDTYSESTFCGGQGRTTVTVPFTAEEILLSLKALEPQHFGVLLSPEQEWVLWTSYPKYRKIDIAKAFGISRTTVQRLYKELVKSGGPRGEKPSYIKE